jgi:hypothetical protein
MKKIGGKATKASATPSHRVTNSETDTSHLRMCSLGPKGFVTDPDFTEVSHQPFNVDHKRNYYLIHKYGASYWRLVARLNR